MLEPSHMIFLPHGNPTGDRRWPHRRLDQPHYTKTALGVILVGFLKCITFRTVTSQERYLSRQTVERWSTSSGLREMQATVATQAPGREAREHGPREGLRADTARVTPKPSNGALVCARRDMGKWGAFRPTDTLGRKASTCPQPRA